MERISPDKDIKRVHFAVLDRDDTKEDFRKPVEGQIIRYLEDTPDDKKQENFVLAKTIGDLHYIVKLFQKLGAEKRYTLAFETDEYFMAATNLDIKAQMELITTVVNFVESVAKAKGPDLEEIDFSPTHAAYTAEDVDSCARELLAKEPEVPSIEEVRKKYPGYVLFYHYKEAFGHDFRGRDWEKENKGPARARLFERAIKRYMPDWNLELAEGETFILRPPKPESA
jgi:hypothetical protein